MGDLTPHFSAAEFASRDGAPHPSALRRCLLCAHLEVLRAIVGNKPMRIVSGHRSVTHNAAVGGAKNSRHIVGDAADLPYGYCTVAQAEEAGFRGIGSRDGFAVHVDLRPSPSRWTY